MSGNLPLAPRPEEVHTLKAMEPDSMANKGLNSWVEKLSRQDMPVVGQVIGELNKLAGSADADANQLAEVILRDPNLTSHVLRIANSVHYNYSGFPINTVSRAIVLIGFKSVRAICVSSLVIESFLKKGPRERLLQMMAHALHAAAQARSLITRFDASAAASSRECESHAEEVFIAALLYHLGEMAFWASDTKPGREDSLALMSPDPATRKAAMDTVLGTSFKAITLELARQWKLGETLERALYPSQHAEPAVTAVLLGERLAQSAEQGWDSPEACEAIRQIAHFLQSEQDVVREQVILTAEAALDIARSYGADVAGKLLLHGQSAEVSADEPAEPATMVGNVELQLNILRELSMAAANGADVNTVMQTVIEGMHRGVGLPRVAIALIRKGRLRARYVLGEGTELWRDKFNFDISDDSDHLFNINPSEGTAIWVKAESLRQHPEWHPTIITELVGRHEAFLATLQLGSHKVGVFYADAAGRWPLSAQQFEGFRHFATQAQFALMLISRHRAQA